MSGTDRHQDIDTLRALACIALVSFHVVGMSAGSGLELPRNHPLVALNAVLGDLRMPLFSFLSGLVFVAARPGVTPADWLRVQIPRKARRLLVPLVAVGTLFWVARHLHGVTQTPLWHLPLLPYAHFWFLQATFVLMMALLALTWLTGGRVRLAAALLGAGGAALWLGGWHPGRDVFSVMGAVRLSAFFAAGVLATQVDWRQIRDRAPRGLRGAGYLLLAGVLAIGVGRVFIGWNLQGPERTALALACGLTGCLSLLMIRPAHAGLARLGRGSYAIYLFHVFFTAGTIEGLRALLPQMPVMALWPLALAAGLAGPLMMQQLLLASRWTSWAFLGLRLRPPAPASAVYAKIPVSSA